MAELVTIPIAVLEVAVDYLRPDFRLWMDRASVVQSVFDALKPWDPRIDDVDAVTTGRASEQGFTVKLPFKRVSFFFGPASFKFSRENLNWQAANDTMAILETAVEALVRSSGVALGAWNTAVALHLQPKSLPFVELLRPFIAPQLAVLEAESVVTIASVAKWDKRKVVIDGSGVLANAIFLRLEREFPANTTMPAMAAQIRQDQAELFRVLGVEEELA